MCVAHNPVCNQIVHVTTSAEAVNPHNGDPNIDVTTIHHDLAFRTHITSSQVHSTAILNKFRVKVSHDASRVSLPLLIACPVSFHPLPPQPDDHACRSSGQNHQPQKVQCPSPCEPPLGFHTPQSPHPSVFHNRMSQVHPATGLAQSMIMTCVQTRICLQLQFHLTSSVQSANTQQVLRRTPLQLPKATLLSL